jgi:hypothetical protein
MRIFYTGDLIVPNGSDVSIYGEGCEEGYGADLTSGWVDPDWSLGEVRELREDVRPDVWCADDGPMIEWIVERLDNRLNGVQVEDVGSMSRGTFYAADPTGPYDSAYTGVELLMAAHVEGASPEMLADVVRRLVRQRYPLPA